ncbi:hypothetical protein BDV19DRAFT_384461 [Aspergillus venezuelensis]
MSDQRFLLSLPYSVRRRIYIELDVITQEPIEPSLGSRNGEWSCREKTIIKGNQPCRKWFTNQLFYVSRAISEDSRTMFYLENRFEFACHISWGLRDIRGFGPLAWASFRRLFFALDRTYHYEGNEYAFEYDEWFWERAKDASEVLPDWLYICEQLTAYSTRDDWLELRFSCDAMEKATAAAFLDPLKNLPRLKDLVIQMGPFFNPGIHEMVAGIIWEKTRAEEFPGAFCFFNLLVELQYRTLEHTNLILPTRLTYSDTRGAFLHPYIRGIFRRDPGKGFCHGRAALHCLSTPHI